jgi:hypothetical protein
MIPPTLSQTGLVLNDISIGDPGGHLTIARFDIGRKRVLNKPYALSELSISIDHGNSSNVTGTGSSGKANETKTHTAHTAHTAHTPTAAPTAACIAVSIADVTSKKKRNCMSVRHCLLHNLDPVAACADTHNSHVRATSKGKLELRGRIWSFLGGNPDLRNFLGTDLLYPNGQNDTVGNLAEDLTFSIWYKVDCSDENKAWLRSKVGAAVLPCCHTAVLSCRHAAVPHV